MDDPLIKFCPRCGGSLSERLLPSEDRPRLTCDTCRYILYTNPKVVAAALPQEDGKVYLLRRGIEPRRGSWTYPGGYMELGESVEGAACRETLEETGLLIEVTSLLGVYSRPQAGVVVIVYLAHITGGTPTLSREALEIATFAPEEIPWEDLSFPSTHSALHDWVNLAASGSPEWAGSLDPG